MTTPMPHTLRPMTLADYHAVVALWRACDGIGLNESDSAEAIAAFLERNAGLSLVALDEAGLIIGAVLCGHDGRRGYLHHLAVAPAQRSRGVGKQLVTACLEALGKLNIAKCNIFLFADNASGREFWLHNGWAARADLVVVQRVISGG